MFLLSSAFDLAGDLINGIVMLLNYAGVQLPF